MPNPAGGVGKQPSVLHHRGRFRSMANPVGFLGQTHNCLQTSSRCSEQCFVFPCRFSLWCLEGAGRNPGLKFKPASAKMIPHTRPEPRGSSGFIGRILTGTKPPRYYSYSVVLIFFCWKHIIPRWLGPLPFARLFESSSEQTSNFRAVPSFS